MISTLKGGLMRFVALMGLLLLCAGAAHAQHLPGVNMSEWLDLAERAETLVD